MFLVRFDRTAEQICEVLCKEACQWLLIFLCVNNKDKSRRHFGGIAVSVFYFQGNFTKFKC